MNHLFDTHYAGRTATVAMIVLLLAMATTAGIFMQQRAMKVGQKTDVLDIVSVALVPVSIAVGLLWSVWMHWPK